MALVPFSYANPFTDQLQLQERLFTIDGELLRIRQAWKGDGKGGTDIGFGASVYPAAYVLAEFLERNPGLVCGKRVIELGTGTGFLGIATAVLGAAEVYLTDGDDDSVRLATRNVQANLSAITRRTFHQPVWDGSARVGCGTRPSLGGDVINMTPQASKNVSTFTGALRSVEESGIEKETEDSEAQSVTRMKGLGRISRGAEGSIAGGRSTHHGSADDEKMERTSDVDADNEYSSRPVSVRKLRWGCSADIRDCGTTCGTSNGSPWEVVIGSDIAALPYASAFDDLLRTIVSLVRDDEDTTSAHTNNSGAIVHPALFGETRRKQERDGAQTTNAEDNQRYQLGSDTPEIVSPATKHQGQRRKPRKVVVLLAHKRRHVSEDAFFDHLNAALGQESCVHVSEEDVHPDFRGMGICLHMFKVNVW